MAAFKLVVFLAVLGSFSFISASEEKLKVSVFYECMCPFSKAFIEKEVWPAYQIIGDYLEVDLIPHGHSSKVFHKNGELKKYKCQHGEWECFGNKIQTCIVNMNVSMDKKMSFVQCVMGQKQPASEKTLSSCAIFWGFDMQNILNECPNLDDLQSDNDRRTKEVIPSKSKVVPFVVFNDEHNHDFSKAARDDFLKIACEILENKPPGCPDKEEQKSK